MVEDYRIKSTAARPQSVGGGISRPTIDYKLRLIQNLEETGKLPTVDFPLSQPENTQIMAFSGKTAEVPITFQIYDNGEDKSAGTLQGSNLRDVRLSIGTVASVPDTTTLRLNGDVRKRLTETSVEQLEFFDAQVEPPSGDCTFDSSQVTYDSANDETVINGVSYGTQPAAGDWTLHTIKTVREQVIYLKRHIFSGQFGANWELRGGRFSNPQGFGVETNTPVAIENLSIRETADRPLRAQCDMKLAIGNIIP